MEQTGSWGSYPSIYAIGHRAVTDLFLHDVNVEEKVDGSQFSFGKHPVDPTDNMYSPGPDGFALRVRSKGAVMHPDAPQQLFAGAVATAKALYDKLTPGWTYRGEALQRPKHNSLVYERTPVGNFILFDVNTGHQEYLNYEAKAAEADRLGLEVVPRLFAGRIETASELRRFLETTSVLGGQKIEGVVVKPTGYNLFGVDKKLLMGKFVSEAFKEVHRKAWGESNPTNKDIITRITDEYTSPARWQKALIHLREEGKIEGSPKDIGLLIKEIPADVLKECADDIKEKLFKYAWQHISRGLTRGLPQWYKDSLLAEQFEREGSSADPVVE